MSHQRDEPAVHRVDDLSVAVPPEATKEEAAAIIAAIGAYREERDSSEKERETAPEIDPWALAARLDATGRAVDRIPDRVPRNLWTVAGRRDRF